MTIDWPCGGCDGGGAHASTCTTMVGWFWVRKQKEISRLALSLGMKDSNLSNMLYSCSTYCAHRAALERKSRNLWNWKGLSANERQ